MSVRGEPGKDGQLVVRARTLVLIALSLAAGLLFLVAWEATYIEIPLVRQIIGLVVMLFLPGFLLLCLLRPVGRGLITTSVMSIGLSIALLMLTGLVLNVLLSQVGVVKPLTPASVSMAQAALVGVLCLGLWARTGGASISLSYAPLRGNKLMAGLLLAVGPPILAVLGTLRFNVSGSNTVSMIMLAVVLGLVLLTGFRKLIPNHLYPFLLFGLAAAMLLHTSLVTDYIWGWDVHHEYYFARTVSIDGYWDPSIPANVNAMLSVTIMVPLLSMASGIGLLAVFKVVLPLLFALVPVVLFSAFRTRWDVRIALYSSLAVIAFYTFYLEMPQLGRQEVAELFFALVLLVALELELGPFTRTALFIAFAWGIVVSHYGLTYIVLICFVLVLALMGLRRAIRYLGRLRRTRGSGEHVIREVSTALLSRPGLVALFAVLAVSWYLYVASTANIRTFIMLFEQMSSAIVNDLFSRESVQGADIVLSAPTTQLHNVGKIIQLVSQFFIAVGLLAFLWRDRRRTSEYYFLSVAFFLVLVAALTLPYFSGSLSTSRMYHICLLVLSPFFIFGMAIMLRAISRPFSASRSRRADGFKVIALFVGLFLAFNSGWIYQLAGDVPTSMALDSEIEYPRFTDPEVMGAIWLHSHSNASEYIYGDEYHWVIMNGYELFIVDPLPDRPSMVDPGSYVIVSASNLESGTLLINATQVPLREYTAPSDIIYSSSRFMVMQRS